jgi:hypothetical protein
MHANHGGGFFGGLGLVLTLGLGIFGGGHSW